MLLLSSAAVAYADTEEAEPTTTETDGATTSAAATATTAEVAPPAQPGPKTEVPAPVVEKRSEPANSINLSPLGALVGNYALTYERLFAGHHGLIVEGIATLSNGDDGDSRQFGGAVGYRWHWRGRQNSGFLGVMFAQGFGTGEVVTNVGGAGEMKHEMTVRSTTITANVGKRWMFGPVNLTVRFGLGWGNHVAEAKEDTPEAKDAEELMNDILAFLPIGIDGELSLGYTF
ncbi:MAG: hypothetical protein M4D80_31230 [Myxococcota bacterium]|nr:hypothetical protein [Deltaproteobacteria bacterium]MDQ3339662.1 hypothetical protein [Myxococcota bacterium]